LSAKEEPRLRLQKNRVRILLEKGSTFKVSFSVEGEEESTLSNSHTKWIEVSSSTCSDNGGEMRDGICGANWENAKTICSQSGGQLPSREDLRQVVVDCGGSHTTYGDKDWKSLTDKNKANKSYQSCYEAKGFRSSDYWSSTSIVGYERTAWIVLFYYGSVAGGYKDSSYYVRCVRAGQ